MRQDLPEASFAERAYLEPLRKSQNMDGGWGFHAGYESRVEPTAWALLALSEFTPSGTPDVAIEKGRQYLLVARLSDGSWPSATGQTEGSWVTSLACWALLAIGGPAESIRSGLQWLIDDRPRDSGFLWKLARKIRERKPLSDQSADYTGWSWTPNTASWVEPTSYALMVLRSPLGASLPESAKRSELAEALLYDRMCPDGGWNCGNPRVYGVAGQPQVGPTAWALIALRHHPERAENRASVEWLDGIQATVQSPESLALTNLALRSYGKRTEELLRRLALLQDAPQLPWSVPALSWAALGSSETSRWLNAALQPVS